MKLLARIIQSLRELGQPPAIMENNTLRFWQERLFHYAMTGLVGLGFLALVPSVWLSWREGLTGLAFFDILAYLLVLVLYFWRALSYEVRALIMIALGYAVGLVVFFEVGEVGAGLYWVFVVPPLASLLLGLEYGLFFLVGNLFFILATGYLVSLNLPTMPQLVDQSLELWLVNGLNFIATNALVTIPLGVLTNGLQSGWLRAAQASEAAFSSQAQRNQALEDLQAAVSQLEDTNALKDAVFSSSPVGILVYEAKSGQCIFANRAAHTMVGAPEGALLTQRFREIDSWKASGMLEKAELALSSGKMQVFDPQMISTFAKEVVIHCTFSAFRMQGKKHLLLTFSDVAELHAAKHSVERRLAELQAINQVSTALRTAETLDAMLPALLDTTLEAVQAERGAIWLYNETHNEVRVAVSRGYTDQQGQEVDIPGERPGEGLAGVIFSTGQMHVTDDYSQDVRIPEAIRQSIPPGVGGVTIPIRAENRVIGLLAVNILHPQVAEEIQIDLLRTLAEMAGSTIHRLALHAQTQRQLQRLLGLSKIDQAITSSTSLKQTLGVILSHLVELLDVDASIVMVYDAKGQQLESLDTRGFRTRAFDNRILNLGEGHAGRAAQQRQQVLVPDLAAQPDNPRLARALKKEDFVSYIGVPLIAKGLVQGVLEIFHRSPLERDREWHDFLNTLAGQTAIAIDNASLFESLAKSNDDLRLAYDATIEGWSRALDLRDRETEGHTRRVTELTLRLARLMKYPEEQLADMRRGALLHDIGKMGIPDSILLKPSSLTELEWEIMRQHPVYARNLLRPMENLRKAIDIPYAHHEKWDGSGYPEGLRGETIPLAARVFAVADVYDALTSNRPYRKAWTKAKAIKYVNEQRGKHFDPAVVDAFLQLEPRN